MKATITWVGALLAGLQAASPCLAQQYLAPVPANYSPVFRTPLGVAPDAMGYGFYTVCPDGTVFGPNYCVYPPFPPFNGMLPGKIGAQIEQGRPWAGTAGAPNGGMAVGPNGAPAYGQQHGGARMFAHNPNGAGGNLAAPGTLMPPDGPINPAFPTHPYVRSPRDFFMWGDMMQEQAARELRPVTAP